MKTHCEKINQINKDLNWYKLAIQILPNPSNKELIAKWQSKGGKYFVELYQDILGFTYKTDNGLGNLGRITKQEAIQKCEQQASYAPSKLIRII